jgi:general secretion pathway protein A
MYTAHFSLKSAPFSITPDPQYLYLTECHREALAHLLYGVREGPGFVLLTGEVGTGKTLLCRCLIEQLSGNVDVVLLLNPWLSPAELLTTLFDELRISYEASFSLKDFFDTLNNYLLTAHAVNRRTVLILDEAQNLTVEVLEQVRLLTNLETATQKLLQIILVGQPELKALLERNDLRQLSQRITARYHLTPLSEKETQAYIGHRLAISGARTVLFNKAAMRQVHRYSKGIPRLINIICDRALLGGYVNNQSIIDAKTVRSAVQEVQGEPLKRPSFLLTWVIFPLVIVLLLSAFAWWAYPKFVSNPRSENITSENIPLPPAPETTLTPAVVSLPPTVDEKEAVQNAVSLTKVLKNTNTVTDLESARTTLFRYWQLDYEALTGRSPCERAIEAKLACLYKLGDWQDIQQINRPALIELITEEGEQHHAVVTQLTADTATLDFTGQLFEFPLTEIGNYWLGQFFVLWQPPNLPISVLRKGQNSENVLWIRKHLNTINGVESNNLSPVFDETLQQQIMLLQQQQGLKPDGVVGKQTMLVLQALAGGKPSLLEVE